MAASRPAGSLNEETGVVDVPDEDMARLFLLLEMAFQTKRLVSLVEHSLIDGTVRRMANDAPLAQCFMLVHERAALGGMTLETGFVLGQKTHPAATQCLLHVGGTPFDRHADVRVVAIRAAHLAFEPRMAMRQLKLRTHFE